MPSNDILKALGGLLDTEPKELTIRIAVVNPSRQGSWIAATELTGIRVIGVPANTPADATMNLFHKLTGKAGYREDGEIQLGLEMAFAQDKSGLFTNLQPTLMEGNKPSEDEIERARRIVHIADMERDLGMTEDE